VAKIELSWGKFLAGFTEGAEGTSMRNPDGSDRKKCPTCGSPDPHLHPAMQFEGEVQPCKNPFHETVTPQNTLDKIAKLKAFHQQQEAK
jgi:hypothetical protein